MDLQQNQLAKKPAAAVGTVTATTSRIDEEAPAYRSVMVGPSSTGQQGLTLSSTSSTGTAEKGSLLPASSTSPFPPPPKSFAAMQPHPQQRLVRGTSNDAVSLSSAASVSTWGSGVSSSVVLPPPSSSAPFSSRWKVPQALKVLPASYKLVRTHVTIPFDDPTTPQRVADTLCTTLKALSITTTTTFDDEYEHDSTFEDAPAVSAAAATASSEEEHNILHAETHYGMKLRIRFFHSDEHISNTNTNNSHQNTQRLVVAITRVAGCSMEFRAVAKVLLRAVKNTEASAGASSTTAAAGRRRKRKSPSSFVIPAGLPPRSTAERHQCIHDEIQQCCRTLQGTVSSTTPTTYVESRLLALESLERMTAKKTTQPKNTIPIPIHETESAVAARCVLGHCDCLCRLILEDYTEEQEEEPAVADEDDADESSSTAAEATYNRRHHSFSSIRKEASEGAAVPASAFSSSSDLVRRKVLTVLANSLEAISGSTEEEFERILATNEQEGTAELIQGRAFLSLLLHCLHDAPSRPHEAYQAVRCLRYLVTMPSTHEHVTDLLLHEMQGRDVLRAQHGFVQCHHAGLERESALLLTHLNDHTNTTTTTNETTAHPLVC